MKKIKIAHLSSVHKDGDIRIFHKECVSLAKAGYDVTCVLANVKERTLDGVKIVTVNHIHKSRLDRMRKTVKLVYKKALKIDADIYHIHDPELLKTGLKLLKKGKKVIYDTHEDTPRQMLSKNYINPFFRSLISRSYEQFENYASKRMSAVVTATPFINDRFLKINPNTININNYPLASEIGDVKTHSEERKREVCYIGGISRNRGIKEIILAAGESKTPVNIGGTWPNGVKEEVSELDAWEYVADLGHISRDVASKVKAKCMAGLVIFAPEPNHVNAQPNKMFEYMASELPVIASNFSLWKSIIETNNCGICVDPSDPKAIASAINQIANDPEKSREMGRNGLSAVLNLYNWDIEEKKLILLYKSLS